MGWMTWAQTTLRTNKSCQVLDRTEFGLKCGHLLLFWCNFAPKRAAWGWVRSPRTTRISTQLSNI